MNQEERRRRRQQDTKNATIVFMIFLIVVVLTIAGAVVLIGKLVIPKEKPDTEPVQNAATENPPATEYIAPPEPEPVDDTPERAAQIVAGMTLEDKVAQMFMVTPNALTGFSGVTAAGDTTREAYQNRPVGGLIYMGDNLTDREQTTTMLTNMQAFAIERTGLPVFLGVDEEGGRVARIAGNAEFGVTNVGDMKTIGATGDPQNAYSAGNTIGTYLAQLGFNVDFAPVADVLTNPDNTVIGDRSFGSDPQMVAGMVTAELQGLSDAGVLGAVKHFPGHGGTSGDSHNEAVSLDRTLEELTAQEFVPFQNAVNAGAPFVMVGHISVPGVTGDNTPASLSGRMITEILRGQMGYNGIVITDGMNMKAVTNSYNSDAASVMAVQAGVDMILMPANFETAYNGVLEAVRNGTITEERINESVVRIVTAKLRMQQASAPEDGLTPDAPQGGTPEDGLTPDAPQGGTSENGLTPDAPQGGTPAEDTTLDASQDGTPAQ